MLYMVVSTHNPESCAFRSEQDAIATSGPYDRFVGEVAEAHGFTLAGSWINRPAHESFTLLDAPSPHAIDEALIEAGMLGRTHTRVLSVIPTADVDVVTPASREPAAVSR